jgi:catechol 2,3-dioxygenase
VTDGTPGSTTLPALTAPRRLGHINLYISNLERSFEFYNQVLGLALVFDEKELFARFLSNGNSHHDVALMQTTKEQLHGRDGQPQGRPSAPVGLNHLAFEMASEAALVEGIRRAKAASGEDAGHFLDHQISRSAYFHATDGVEVELYADSTKDWRGTYAGLGDELMSERWDPLAVAPSESSNYTAEMTHIPEPTGLARPLRTARAALVVGDLVAAREFYLDVIGLEVIEEDLVDGRWSIVGGTVGLPDLLLLERLAAEPLGFHHFSLELESLAEFAATEARLADAGIPVERDVSNPRKRGLVLIDPDGIRVELFALRDAPAVLPSYRSIATRDNREYLS